MPGPVVLLVAAVCCIDEPMNINKLAEELASADAPLPASAELARCGAERWQVAVDAINDPSVAHTAACLRADPKAVRLLESLFGNSPFVTFVAEREPAFTVSLLCRGPDRVMATLWDELAETHQGALAGIDPGAALRRTKRRLSLAVALADIAGIWTLEQVTEALSECAERALDAALAYLLVDAARRGVISVSDADDPLRGCGVIVLGMGKLGGRELNYSSDIDLIVFYDPERFRTANIDEQQKHAARITRGLVRLMAERTVDGYVFRTDLRLRPDPGSTPVAISTVAAEEYYETLGQNWERAALIKARPVAGDRDMGEAFLRWLRPFIWRKHLDFAAIQDIHSIKRQIDAHRGGGRITLGGHNVKLGRGGIREIEFFAQTQQLIWGGRIPMVRVNRTVDALAALARAGKIDAAVATEMTDAYRFLRRVEHRLQMIDDAQTHTLPTDPGKLSALATFLGYPDIRAFEAELMAMLHRVAGYYAELFQDAPALALQGDIGGNLVFTGADPDPETLATLERLGFAHPETVDAAVRGWHHGRSRATRSVRARQLLTELMPQLLLALAEKPDPDIAFLAFDRFLKGLPAGIQLFSMFCANRPLLGLVTDILGVAPQLAEHLARHPSVLESVLSAPDFFEPPPPLPDLIAELHQALSVARDEEDVLDLSRRWANDRRFQVGVQTLKGMLDTPQAEAAWTQVADAALTCLLPRMEERFAAVHGRIEGCGMAIIGMGKLGGREMTTSSDLDLIFVYTTTDEVAESDGRRPLAPQQYFARLSQRLIAAMTAPTTEGRLYEVDMRLRPSGKAGPIAVSATTFAHYQRDMAWVWEQMALTRARVVAGPPALVREIETVIRRVLARPRDAAALVVEVADMRARMAEEHRAASIWEVKHLRGGMVDVEFIAQYLQLLHAHRHPDVLSTNTADALARLQAAGVLAPEVAGELIAALELWHTVQNRIRLNLGKTIGPCGPDDAPKAVRLAVDGIAGLSFPALFERMQATAERVYEVFRTLVDVPAAAVRHTRPAGAWDRTAAV